MAPIFGGGGRKRNALTQPSVNWPLDSTIRPSQEHRVLHPPMPVIEGRAAAVPDPTPDEELLEMLGTFRGAVADALYEVSKDYQILCNLTHAELTACDEIVVELRQRLAGVTHYAVLAKLDEAYALVEAKLAEK
jgi:hypothetical protein